MKRLLALAALTLGGAQAASCGPFGISINTIEQLQELEGKTGCTFTAVRWFQEWTPFNLKYAQRLVKLGRTLEVSWQPRRLDAQGRAVGIPYRDIAAGKHDEYLRQFASSIRSLGQTVTITFAPEMNGDWGAYQLSAQNTPEHFKQAWRHMHGIFRKEKAPVRWVWSPNVLYPGVNSSYAALYPGDAYVDEVGLDGYNWGTVQPNTRWKSFAQTFGPSYEAIKKVTSKPIQLGEFGSVEQGGNKAEWIMNACYKMPAYNRVKRAFWFHIYDYERKADWRITTSQASLNAFKRCVALRK